MFVELNEKVAEKVVKLANEMGLSYGSTVGKILEWYFEDCENKK
jgi:hypothetical protein